MRLRILPSELKGSIIAPPSKPYTHRALFLASLADGRSVIIDPLISRDTMASVRALEALGVKIVKGEGTISIDGAESLSVPDDVIDVENSGTTLRVMTAISSLVPKGYTVITGDESVRRRPMGPLLEALRSLGVECYSTRESGLPPIVVRGGGLRGGDATIPGHVSSQFVTALLLACLRSKEGLRLKVEGGIVSKPYIDATIEAVRIFGGFIGESGGVYTIEPGQRLVARRFRVPGDYGSASFMLVAGALAGEVEVRCPSYGLPQPDGMVIDILRDLGVDVRVSGDVVNVEKARSIGGSVDLSDCPDLLPPLSALGLVSDGLELRGVKHARYKESDRIAVIARELPKLGVRVEELEDGLFISKGDLKPALLDPSGDHRLFMAFSIACLITGGEVLDPGSASISYPGFIRDMERLGAKVGVVG